MNGAPSTKTKVLRLRLKDKHAKFLSELAREVNFVWNYCNELQITMFNRERRFLSGYDFAKFTRGATKEGVHLHSQTVQGIAEEYATRRRHCRQVRLSWRKSTGSRCSLGWIPFKKVAIQVAHGQVKFAGRWLSLWDSYGLDSHSIRAGNVCEDARGRWWSCARDSCQNRQSQERFPASVLDSYGAHVRHDFFRQCQRLRARQDTACQIGARCGLVGRSNDAPVQVRFRRCNVR
jgi:hypothetical protein